MHRMVDSLYYCTATNTLYKVHGIFITVFSSKHIKMRWLSPLSSATSILDNFFLKQFWVLRMGSGVSWHEEWSCSVVWRYGSMAAGWTDCGRGGCCRVVSCGLCVDIWLHLCHWCLINGTRNVPKRFKSPAVEPSFPGQCTNHASLWCFQSGCFLLLLCDSWPEYCLRI